MSVEFQKSETRENLMRAFAGESQARNRYTFAASQARRQQLPVIEAVFSFTANQERAHAKIFYDHLKQLAGTTIHVDGGYPVDISASVSDLLKAAQHNEYEEHDPVYRTFGDIAREEGFPEIAASFHNIAKIEKTHGDRFGAFARLLDEGRLFSSWLPQDRRAGGRPSGQGRKVALKHQQGAVEQEKPQKDDPNHGL